MSSRTRAGRAPGWSTAAERGGAVADRAHRPALALQRAGQQLHEQGVVLDEQHVEARRGRAGGRARRPRPAAAGQRLLELVAQAERDLGELGALRRRRRRSGSVSSASARAASAAARATPKVPSDTSWWAVRAPRRAALGERARGQQGQGRVLELGDPLEEHLAGAQQQLAHELGTARRKGHVHRHGLSIGSGRDPSARPGDPAGRSGSGPAGPHVRSRRTVVPNGSAPRSRSSRARPSGSRQRTQPGRADVLLPGGGERVDPLRAAPQRRARRAR